MNKISRSCFSKEEKRMFSSYLSKNKHKTSIQPNKIKKGMWIDVRDTLNVWCKAIVTEIIHPKGSDSKILKVHYLGWSTIYDEFIPSNSSRVARVGTYTEKEDIAKYQMYFT